VHVARRPLATLSLAGEQLDPMRVWTLAVAPHGDALALKVFDEHGVVVYERTGTTYQRAADFPILHSTRLAFDATGELLVASGDGLNLVRRTREEPVRSDPPAYPIRDPGFAIEDCARSDSTIECSADHQLRARANAEPHHVVVTAHAFAATELARFRTPGDWIAAARARFHFDAADIAAGLDLGLVTWGAPGARALEYHHQDRASCPSVDRFVRIQERDGWLWRIEVAVPPDTADAIALPVVRTFIDDFAGAPPSRKPRVLPGPTTGPHCLTI
jgi:hypothetical protein